MSECVCCGAIIPEGRQVCPDCEIKTRKNEERYNAFVTYPDGERHFGSGTMKEIAKWVEVELLAGADEFHMQKVKAGDKHG